MYFRYHEYLSRRCQVSCVWWANTNEQLSNHHFPQVGMFVVRYGKFQACHAQRDHEIRSKCSNQPIMIFDTATGQYKQETNFHIPLNPLKQSILAKYKKDMIQLFEQMKEFEDENITTITRFHRKFFTLIIFILLLLLSTLISLCVRFIQNRIKQQLYIAERRINNLHDVFLGNDDQI